RDRSLFWVCGWSEDRPKLPGMEAGCAATGKWCGPPSTNFQVMRTPRQGRARGVTQLSKLLLRRQVYKASEYGLDAAARLDSRQSRRWTDNEDIESPSSRWLRSRNTGALLRDS